MANPLKEPVDSFTPSQAAEHLANSNILDGMFGDDEAPEQDEPDANPPEAEPDQDDPEQEASDDQSESDAEPEEESIALETIDDVAAALGVDPGQLLDNLKLRIKVNGQEQLITLSEAQKGNQFEQDYRHKTSELAEHRRSLEAERSAHMQSLQQAATETMAALQFTEQMIGAEINSPFMAELRQTNPAEWVARARENEMKLQALHAARHQAQQQVAQVAQQQHAAHQQRLAAMLTDQDSQLRNKVSDWNESRKTDVARFLSDRYGYSEQELSGVYDHRLILMAMDAQKGAQAAQETAKVMQKVKTLPKVQKPGKTTSPVNVKAKQVATLRSSLRKSGSLRDAARLIEASNLI